jgi:calcineurin-like phosphoesterase family protein
MSNIWFSADWHKGHANIVRGVSQWENKSACRDFETLEEHDQTLIDNINKVVKKDDIVFMLGDWAFGGRQNIYELWKQLNCKNIHLCLGNHDHHIRKNAKLIDDNGQEIKAQSLFLSVNDIIFKKIGHDRIVMCHYAMRTWENGHHGAIMLYGHSHGSLPDYQVNLPVNVNEDNGTLVKSMRQDLKFKTMDVGVDTHPEFRPYHIDEIRVEMSKRIPLRVDHHDDNTN